MDSIQIRSPDIQQPDLKMILRDNFRLISRSLNLTKALLFELSLIDKFKDKLQVVKQQETLDDKVQELIKALYEVPQTDVEMVFGLFLSALRNDGQEHVANIFRPGSVPRPMSDTNYKRLSSNADEIGRFLDPQSGLVGELVKANVFTDSDRRRVLSKSGYELMSREIVDILSRKSETAFDEFLTALRNTEQEHVVHILTGEGEPPLSRLRRCVLRTATDELVQRIEIVHSLLMPKLITHGVLNDADKQQIEARPDDPGKISALLDVIARKSQKAYDKFIQALKDSTQYQVAVTLEGLELKAFIDAHFSDDVTYSQKNKIVKIIRKDMEALVIAGKECSIRQLMTLMEQNGFAVTSVRDGSILIRFRCFDEESLENLKRMYADKTLDQLFTGAFCSRYANSGLKSLSLYIDERDFAWCTKTFQETAPMTRWHRLTLVEAAEKMADRISVSEDLLNKLSLSNEHVEAVRRLDDNRERLRTLLGIVSRQPDRAFSQLLDALGKTRQNDAADFLANYKRVVGRLPVKLLELVLMKAFVQLFAIDDKNLQRVYVAVSSVCYGWWQTMRGWQESRTKNWFKHRLHRCIEYVCHPFVVSPQQQSSFPIFRDAIGLAYCDGKLYVICEDSVKIFVFQPDTNQRRSDIKVKEMKQPTDMAVCVETRQLYVADSRSHGSYCVWRISLDGRQVVEKWLPNKMTTKTRFKPSCMSVRQGRLLVVSRNDDLFLYGSDGAQLRRVSLAKIKAVQHAVETTSGTFVVCHKEPQVQISEVNLKGAVIRVYSGQQELGDPCYMSLDSDGRLFVTDFGKRCVSLLNSRLELDRVLLDARHLVAGSRRMCYAEQTGQLFVAGCDWMSSYVHVFLIRDDTR